MMRKMMMKKLRRLTHINFFSKNAMKKGIPVAIWAIQREELRIKQDE